MQFKAVFLGAFATLAAAQSSVLTFTRVPDPVTDGQAQAITYSTNDTASPVTIILRKGVSTDLQTISTLTSSSIGGQFIWTPSSSLQDGDDYALQITQGTQTNYFGPFTIQGASASASSSAPSGTKSSSMSASAIASSLSSVIASANSSLAGLTSSSMSSNLTTATAVVTTTPGVSAGTGSPIPRNTTMSIATLSSSSSSAGVPVTNTATSTATSTAAGTSGAGFQGTSATSASASSSATSGASDLVASSSQLVLVFGAIAAVFYLQ